MKNEKIEKFNEMTKETFKNYDHQRKIDVSNYFDSINDGEMKKAKVVVDSPTQDLIAMYFTILN